MRRYRFSTQHTGPAQASQWQHALGNLLKSHVGTDQERHDLIHRTLDYGLGWRGDK